MVVDTDLEGSFAQEVLNIFGEKSSKARCMHVSTYTMSPRHVVRLLYVKEDWQDVLTRGEGVFDEPFHSDEVVGGAAIASTATLLRAEYVVYLKEIDEAAINESFKNFTDAVS